MLCNCVIWFGNSLFYDCLASTSLWREWAFQLASLYVKIWWFPVCLFFLFVQEEGCHLSLWCPLDIWAATWQNQHNACAPSEESDQSGHPPSLIRVFAVRMKKASVLSYSLSAQRRLIWLGGYSVDLSLRWAHSHFGGFVMRRLILSLFSLSSDRKHITTNLVAKYCWENSLASSKLNTNYLRKFILNSQNQYTSSVYIALCSSHLRE